MKQTYMTKFYRGSFVSETLDTKVEDRTVPSIRPDGCYAVLFYDREEEMKDGELLIGKEKNYSPTYYWGKAMTLEDVKREMPNSGTLIRNMQDNNFKRVVKTVSGNFMVLRDDDVVVGHE